VGIWLVIIALQFAFPGTGNIFVYGLILFAIWIILFPLLMFTAHSVAAASASHPGGASDILAECAGLLESQGFTVKKLTQPSLLAKRKNVSRLPKGGVEQEWKVFPIRVLVTATESGSSSVIEVTGECKIPQVRQVLAQTCRAVAALDGLELARLDRVIPVRQGGLSLSGLGRKIFSSIALFSLISVVVTLGLGAIVQRNFLNSIMGYSAGRVYLFEMRDHIFDTLELPVQFEIDRQLAAQPSVAGLPAAEKLAGIKPILAEGQLVIALQQADGTINLIQPRPGDEVEPIVRAMFLSDLGDASERMEQAGDRIFLRFNRRYRGKLASRLGLEGGQLAIGLLLSYAELATLAPKNRSWSGIELTYYKHGTSLLRYSWWVDSVIVNQGAGSLPREVIVKIMDATMPNLIFWLPDQFYTFHEETHNGRDQWVSYAGDYSSKRGWSGWSIAFDKRNRSDFPNLFLEKELYIFAIVQVGIAALLPLLFLVFICSPFIAARISRPVLAVRDALRAISEGDYSVRLKTERKDEIGQLQQMLNRTAEELRKRESVKDLMGKYLSKQVADRILASDTGETLVGVRREVSVLFADVRGFTTYSERHDPEQVTKSLNEYFEVMVDVIAVHEGVLDKYIGDGLMVVFGAPIAQEDHARRAVITALEMQAALQSLNLKRLQRGDEPISIGIGVNTGLAISGNLGSLKRMEFTVIGDTVNTAARLESNAKQGQILIGKRTYERVQDLIECEALGPIPVKGKAEPVEVWWLKGLKPRARV
jgi:class 3 adenylate cyclase